MTFKKPTKPKTLSGPQRKTAPRADTLPTREQLLAALAEQSDIKGKRDLAKVFGIRGDMRRPFKAMLAWHAEAGKVNFEFAPSKFPPRKTAANPTPKENSSGW